MRGKERWRIGGMEGRTRGSVEREGGSEGGTKRYRKGGRSREMDGGRLGVWRVKERSV